MRIFRAIVLRLIVILLLMFAKNEMIFGQELIAKADTKIETAITVHYTNPAEDLYDLIWDSSHVHIYKNLEPPQSYNIDLTNFSMPLDDTTRITSQFGYRPKFKRNHNGIDLKAYIGDSIYAVFDGKVRAVGYNANGYGYYVVIRHYNGLETVYGHLSKQLVSKNQIVKSGEVIGLAGNTGRSFGSHLHFETRFCGLALNPLELFDFQNEDIKQDYYEYRR